MSQFKFPLAERVQRHDPRIAAGITCPALLYPQPCALAELQIEKKDTNDRQRQ
jgi:hypothetical protein